MSPQARSAPEEQSKGHETRAEEDDRDSGSSAEEDSSMSSFDALKPELSIGMPYGNVYSYSLINTCPIDSMMTKTYSQAMDPRAKVMEILKASKNQAETYLYRALRLMLLEKMTLAKDVWIDYLALLSDQYSIKLVNGTYNCFGAESDHFIRFFSFRFQIPKRLVCSFGRECPGFHRLPVLDESIHVIRSKEKSVLSQVQSYFEPYAYNVCGARLSDEQRIQRGDSKAQRHIEKDPKNLEQEREYWICGGDVKEEVGDLPEDAWLLVLHLNTSPPNAFSIRDAIMELPLSIHIGSQSFELGGISAGSRAHFVAYILQNLVWYFYNGLVNGGRLTEVIAETVDDVRRPKYAIYTKV